MNTTFANRTVNLEILWAKQHLRQRIDSMLLWNSLNCCQGLAHLIFVFYSLLEVSQGLQDFSPNLRPDVKVPNRRIDLYSLVGCYNSLNSHHNGTASLRDAAACAPPWSNGVLISSRRSSQLGVDLNQRLSKNAWKNNWSMKTGFHSAILRCLADRFRLEPKALITTPNSSAWLLDSLAAPVRRSPWVAQTRSRISSVVA